MLEKEKEPKRRLASMLKSVPLFAGLDSKDLERIAESGREVFFETGKTILRKGELGLAGHPSLEEFGMARQRAAVKSAYMYQ